MKKIIIFLLTALLLTGCGKPAIITEPDEYSEQDENFVYLYVLQNDACEGYIDAPSLGMVTVDIQEKSDDGTVAIKTLIRVADGETKSIVRVHDCTGEERQYSIECYSEESEENGTVYKTRFCK